MFADKYTPLLTFGSLTAVHPTDKLKKYNSFISRCLKSVDFCLTPDNHS